jgi:hypothetical protein
MQEDDNMEDIVKVICPSIGVGRIYLPDRRYKIQGLDFFPILGVMVCNTSRNLLTEILSVTSQ